MQDTDKSEEQQGQENWWGPNALWANFQGLKKITDFYAQKYNSNPECKLLNYQCKYGFLVNKKDQEHKGRNLSPRKAMLLSKHSSANVTSSCLLSLPELTKSERSAIFCKNNYNNK